MSDLIGGFSVSRYKGLRKSDSKRIIVIPDKDMSHHITGYMIDKYKIGIMKQRVNLTSDEDPTDEDEDIGVLVSLDDAIILEGKKSQESNIGDSDNTRDGGKTAGRAIITWGGGIASYACMFFIYRSSCKGEKTSMSKRYLVKSSKDSGETFLGEAGK
ncbi:hypothetical protein Tco_0009101 [Tanacetum coccineum]